MKQRLKLGCIGCAAIALAIAATFLAFIFVQGRRTPNGDPQYVALGSSFAAGAGLGALQSGSPLVCARSVNGYPQQLARRLQVPIVDMSCGGATARHVLQGGQFFQGSQLRVVDRRTRLVTITVGGNDIGYVGDLSMLAARHTNTAFGWLVRHLWGGPKAPAARDFATLKHELVAIARTIHQRSPGARVVLVSYPAVLPPTGTCDRLGLSNAEANLMREVAHRLALATQAAAKRGGAIFVDMNSIGAAHSACSDDPWTRGWTNGDIAPFHPSLRGAEATADALVSVLGKSPAGIATVRQDNAAGH